MQPVQSPGQYASDSQKVEQAIFRSFLSKVEAGDRQCPDICVCMLHVARYRIRHLSANLFRPKSVFHVICRNTISGAQRPLYNKRREYISVIRNIECDIHVPASSMEIMT
jgi:hypothetical protein